ncbi:hypothetical protein EVJ58_g909 [Rhodofomes roseus]|uniref:COP9 signalosome complex subunit 2 n=1 Tax=Rhodofomes roseus TaxID=34475 RepID=A0A4Y9Z414_9APHY|nr:hypothetical protein EVJ58_g909 [Rhodofomes roseus]
MDDDDADYMQGSDDEDYGFDYSDDDQEDATASADVENMYYTAKSKKEDNPEQALKEFRVIVDQEEEKGDWGFKALKQSTKILFLQLHRPNDALQTYNELLTYTKSAVTRNYSEKTINGILDYVGGGKGGPVEVDVLEKFYQATKAALQEAKNEVCDMYLAPGTAVHLPSEAVSEDKPEAREALARQKAVPPARKAGTDGEDVAQKGTQLLEIYALEIQMHNETKNFKKLKEIYNASNSVRSAIPHPRILGVIKECGGKMWMGERQWNRASEDFFESFKNYDEAGSPQRIQVLKYLVLANMLTGSEVNPFDSQETKPYKNDPQIKAMTDLVDAYQRREVHTAEKILRDNRTTMDDPFIQSYIGELLRSLRTQYLIDLIKPYTRLELSFLAKQLNVDNNEVEDLLIGLILEGKVEGKIDQVSMRLELSTKQSLEKRRYDALDKWTGALESVQNAIIGKAQSGNRGTDTSFGVGSDPFSGPMREMERLGGRF